MRHAAARLVGAVAVAGAVFWGCGIAGDPAGAAGYGRSATTPTARAARQAGLGATAAYLQTVGLAVTAFSSDLDELQAAVSSGDTAGAKNDELDAQSEFDALRYVAPTGDATTSAQDGLAADLPPGAPLTGLHLVEEDLWDGGDPAPAVAALIGQAPELEVALSRDRLDPGAIVTDGVDALGWVNDVAIPGRSEVYSHLDVVDVSATVDAVDAALADVSSLGRLVDRSAMSLATQRMKALMDSVHGLGDPATTTDTSVPTASWRSVAQADDAAAAALSALAPHLDHDGPRQLYGYSP